MQNVLGAIVLSANGASASNSLIPCDGRTLSVGQYPQMALAWAATPQDPSSTFTLPDLRSAAPVCQNTRRRLIYSTPSSGLSDSLTPGSPPVYDDLDVSWPTVGTIVRFPFGLWGPWSGLLCDGRFVGIQQYPALYATIGQLFWGSGSTNPAITQEFYFRLPNLTGPITDTAFATVADYWIADSGLFATDYTPVDWGTA